MGYNWTFLACLLLLVCGATVATSDAPVVLQTHRLVEYRKGRIGRGGSGPGPIHGSPKASLRGLLVTTLETDSTQALPQPILIAAKALPSTDAEMAALLERSASGLLVMLPPRDPSSTGGDDGTRAWQKEWSSVRRLARVGASSSDVAGAVVAVEDGPNATALRQLLRDSVAVHVVGVPASEPGPHKAEKLPVVVAEAASSKSAKLFVITAGFDTLGGFPSLPSGPASAADLAVLIELSTLFAPQAEDLADANSAGLVFVASAGDRHSYHGLRQWAAGEDGRAVLDRADGVISIEGLALSEDVPLLLHAAHSPSKDEAIQTIVEAFGGVSKPKVVKVDPEATELRLAHEVFAHRGYPAVTFAPAELGSVRQIQRDGFPSDGVDVEELAKTVDTIATALSTLTGVKPAAGGAQTSRLRASIGAAVAAVPRRSYAMPSSVVDFVQKALTSSSKGSVDKKKKKRGPKVRRLEYAFAPPEAVFAAPDGVVVTAYAARSLAFELTITAAIVVGVAVASFASLGRTEGTAFLMNPLARK